MFVTGNIQFVVGITLWNFSLKMKFIKNNDLSISKTENIEKRDTFWEDWDNQK